MIGAKNFIRRGLVFHTYQMLLLFRYHKTEYSEDEVLVVVAKFGAPSLEEEVSGRLEHKVTITSKRMTKALATLPPIAKFNYGCSCKAKKTFCIHVAIVLLSDFSDDQMIWFVIFLKIYNDMYFRVIWRCTTSCPSIPKFGMKIQQENSCKPGESLGRNTVVRNTGRSCRRK